MMATITQVRPARRAETFWLGSAIVMTAVLVAGFSLSVAMGRSSFGAPAYVHVHALVFFGWTLLYLVQNILADSAHVATHRRLGWLAVGWLPAMVVMGIFVTVALVRRGHAPFFFQPLYFLVMDPLAILTFAGLATAAIVRRRRTQWHRRLMLCAMAILTGPGFGRLLPMPLFIPFAGGAVFTVVLLFPLAGVLRDLRRTGRVHPAWWWGIGTIALMQAGINLVVHSPAGPAVYRFVTAGSPGANVAPLAFPPFPRA